MYDMVTIGDIKLDVFISLDNCSDKCGLKQNKLFFEFGEKISVLVEDQQIASSAPNVATALSRMGKKTAIISNMGDDMTYTKALEFFNKENIASRYVKSHKNTKSAYSAVLNLDGEKTILASYVTKPYKLPPGIKTKWFYMSEMGKGYEKVYDQLIKRIHKDKTLLGFNPGNEQIRELKPMLFKLIKHTKTLFVNVEEGQRIVKNKRLKIPALADKLFKLGPNEVIITDGRAGSYGYDGTNLYFCPIVPSERVEATGAGDSFASGYLGARMHGLSMQEGLRWGTVNAAASVTRIGPTLGLLRDTQIKARLRKLPKFVPEKIG
jgi:sugar/nucleoside kinase (ribokinase family)